MEGNQTILRKPDDIKATSKDNDDYKAFTFDQSYWSADKSDPAYADQQKVYSDLGVDLLDHAFDGYNCCIFACMHHFYCLVLPCLLLYCTLTHSN